MRNFAILLAFLVFGYFSHKITAERNLTTFEFSSDNGNLNGSVDSQVYEGSQKEDIANFRSKEGSQNLKSKNVNNKTSENIESTTKRGNNNYTVERQNRTASGNRTEKANFAIFNPNFWKNLLGIFQGNVKVGVHGDLSNVASGNLESRGSVGISVNGQDLTVGAKFGIGGNLGQGVSNTGSIGAGGKFAAKPSIKFSKPRLSLASLPLRAANGNYSEVNSDGGNGNWQNMKQNFKVFVDRPQ